MVQFQSYAVHFTVFLSVVSGTVLIAMVVKQPGSRSSYARETTCKGLGSRKVGARKLNCEDFEKPMGRDSDNDTYPCYKVDVQYYVDEVDSFENSTLYEEEDSSDNSSDCFMKPSCSESAESNNRTFAKFLDDYGKRSKQYKCHYNYKNRKQVFLHSRSNKGITITAIAIPALFLAIAATLMAISCKKKFLRQQDANSTNQDGAPDLKRTFSLEKPAALDAYAQNTIAPPPFSPSPQTIDVSEPPAQAFIAPPYIELADSSVPPPYSSNPSMNKQPSVKSLKVTIEQTSTSRSSLPNTGKNDSTE